MLAGDPPQSIYLILEGSVSILLEDENRRELVPAYLNPGDLFGELCLFPEQQSRTAIVRMRTPTLAVALHYDAFLKFYGEDSALMRSEERRVGKEFVSTFYNSGVPQL